MSRRFKVAMSPTMEQQAVKFKERRLADFVYELLKEENPDVELVFFHGLQMEGSPPEYSHWRTWKLRDSEECWPETLLPRILKGKDSQLKPRVLSISYEGRLNLAKYGNVMSDEYLISECLVDNIIFDCRVGQRKGVPVFLIGHDLGGILIKRFVMMVENQGAVQPDAAKKAKILSFLENLKSVFFFATPHCGSPAIEKMAASIPEDDANQMLQLMKVLSKHTARTNEEFRKFRLEKTESGKPGFTSHAIHASHVTNEGGFYNVVVVPEGSSRNDVDSFYTTSANHFSVCQPRDESSSPVKTICKEIMEVVSKAKDGSAGTRGRR
ncbi:hypothetical protein R1flu_015876 [Riccia fluitans]|uniref:DUF676 domain-containing protein n=1 Tax=Riccia fluitans TaxID=41844 RepID=A0ABD1YKH0_9MARC